MIYITNNRNKENYFYQTITMLKRLICTFKKYPILTLVIGIFIIFLWQLLQIVFHFIGLTVIMDSWLLYYISLLTRVIFLKIVICLVTLPFFKNIYIWYNHLGMAPFIPLLLAPFSLISYEIILPIVTGGFLINLQNGLTFFKNIFLIVIKVMGEYLVEFHNFLGVLGKYMVTLAEWGFSYPLKSISRKHFLLINYNNFKIISPFLVRIRDNIKYWNYTKSMVYYSPINTSVPISDLKGGNDFICVKGSLKNLISFISKNSTDIIHKVSLINISQTKIYLQDEGITLGLELNKELLEVKIISSNKVFKGQGYDKFSYPCDRKSFFEPVNGLNRIFNQKDELLRLTTFKGSDKNLMINMQNNLTYYNPELESNVTESSGDDHIVSGITGYPLIQPSADYSSTIFPREIPACELIEEQQG